MADAVPAQVESDPGPARDTAKVVSAETRAGEASVVERVNKGEAEKTFVPLANPDRVPTEQPGIRPEPKGKRIAYRKAQAADDRRDEQFKGGVDEPS